MGIRNKPVLTVLVNIAIFGFLAWLGFAVVHGNGGILERRKTERVIARLENEIDMLEHEIARTDLAISNLKHNRRHLTQLARELGYMRQGETIYRFMSKKDAAVE